MVHHVDLQYTHKLIDKSYYKPTRVPDRQSNNIKIYAAFGIDKYIILYVLAVASLSKKHEIVHWLGP